MKSVPQIRKNRNLVLEFCKLCAAFLVVFLHTPFPGGYGQAIATLALSSVPFFFSVSGYFSYGVDRNTIAKRMAYIFKLSLISSLIYMLSNWFFAAYSGVPFEEYKHWDSIFPTTQAFFRWLILHWNPFSEHLWYLTAMCFCYFFLWAYLAFYKGKGQNYSRLYTAGIFPTFVLVFFGCITPYAGFTMPYISFRNGWIYGPALFLTGMFIHEHETFIIQELKMTNGKLFAIFAAGAALALGAWRTGTPSSIPLGTLIQIPALLLLCIQNPHLPKFGGKWSTGKPSAWKQKQIARLGSLYTAVYILHMAVGRVYSTFLQTFVDDRFGVLAPWLHPVLILLLTLAVSFAWEPIERRTVRKPWIIGRKS